MTDMAVYQLSNDTWAVAGPVLQRTEVLIGQAESACGVERIDTAWKLTTDPDEEWITNDIRQALGTIEHAGSTLREHLDQRNTIHTERLLTIESFTTGTGTDFVYLRTDGHSDPAGVSFLTETYREHKRSLRRRTVTTTIAVIQMPEAIEYAMRAQFRRDGLNELFEHLVAWPDVQSVRDAVTPTGDLVQIALFETEIEDLRDHLDAIDQNLADKTRELERLHAIKATVTAELHQHQRDLAALLEQVT